MPATDLLRDALKPIDWKSLEAMFLKETALATKVAECCERLALWSNEIRAAEPKNPAAPFLLEMQRTSQDVAALLAIAMYVPAAASMRAACETALYYTYFRTHPAELATIAASSEYFITKNEILAFHKAHSQSYQASARMFGLPGALDTWYSKTSAIIHGQLPGRWGKRLSLKDTKHSVPILTTAVQVFEEGVDIIGDLLLLTVGVELWGHFHHETKAMLLKGMAQDRRASLSLEGK